MDTSVGLPPALLKVLLSCGIIAALLGIGTDMIAGMIKPGYRFDTQSASILHAFGSPTRPYVLPFLIASQILMIAFAVGVWFAADQNWVMRVTAGLIAGNAVFAMTALLFFPMHPGEAMNTEPNKLNVVFMGISVLLFFLAIGFGAAANRNWFRYFSIGIILMFFVVDILALRGVRPALGGAPGPLVGIQERAMGYGDLIWLAFQAIVLLRG